MSEVRDYGLDGATPSRVDLEAQSPQSPVQPQERENKHSISPTVSYVF